ncbi:MAG: class I SAM-dependent methyltransferase [Flavobacteriales bacterium]
MRNVDQWKPSKFVLRKGRLIGSRDTNAVGFASRVMVDLVGRFYQRALPQHARGRLVDLGCGHVPLFATYKDHVESVTCVDWGNSLHQNPYLDKEQDLNQPIAFPDASFDTIVLSDVLEHIRRPEELIREMYRILAPGGRVIMNVPYYYGLHEQPFDYYRYTQYALRAMTEDAGFKVEELESIGGVPEIMTDLFSKTVRGVPVVGRPLARFAQAFTGWFVRGGLGAKLSRRTANDFPFGYALVLQKP